jgi:hypothetical protein
MWQPLSAPPATAGDLGSLEILAVESYTNHTLSAYEQSRGQWELQRLASYVLLMVSVVDARRDVEVPQWAGVFVHGDKTAAFYEHLGKETTMFCSGAPTTMCPHSPTLLLLGDARGGCPEQ